MAILLKYRFNAVIFFIVSLIIISCNHKNIKSDQKVFELLEANSLGVGFINNLVYTEEFNTYLYRSFYNGAGTGLADFNNDGFLDLFFCGNQVNNALYLGDGNFQFKDITHESGVLSPDGWSTGVSIVDINQDGWLDIYVCKSGNPKDKNRRNELFINTGLNSNGIPVFKESAETYGINDLGFSIHAIFFDYDKDGDLDMYLSNNSINPSEVVIDVRKGIRNRPDSGGGDKLYRNDNGFFVNVSKEAGIYSSAIGFGLGISVSDINRDGWPDIYVANDFFEKDYLYINNHDGTFTESIDKLAGEISMGSMGVDIADMNHDGYPEIFVTEMLPSDEGRLKTKTMFDNWDKYVLKEKNGYHRQFSRNAFQMSHGRTNNNNVFFSEISRYAGVEASDWSWGVQMVDFDLDGNKDIFITNGIAKDLLDQDYIDFYNDPSKIRKILREKGVVIKELIDNIPSQPISNNLFTHSGNLQFKNVATEWGLDQLSFSSGAAYGDIDNDGDLDLVVNNIDQSPFIYKNNTEHQKKHYISLDIKNENGNSAIGAQVTLTVEGKKYFQELYRMRGVMSVVDNRLNFGLGDATSIDTLEIIWPNGAKQIETNLGTDTFLTYQQPEEKNKNSYHESSIQNKTTSLLTDATSSLILDYVHQENNFVDFDREKLLCHMISNEGPKIAISDINNDGKDDFYIGGAKGVSGGLFVQTKNGFLKTNEELFEKDKLSEDIGILFFDADNDNDMDLLVTSGGIEFSASSFALFDRLYINMGDGNFKKSHQLLPNARPLSTSVVINVDFDSDGDQDLFFGGRVASEAYGIPVSSYLLENDGQGFFKDITKEKAPDLLNIGMVTDAKWTDFDVDGDQDLIVVGDWMPIRLFDNNNDVFEEITNQTALIDSNGFWNTLEVVDLDGDGYKDIIAGNIGENTLFKAEPNKPVQMFVNDFDSNGTVEQIITTYNGGNNYPIVQKKEITSQMPYLLKKYLKHSDYKLKTVKDIFSNGELENAIVYETYQNKSMIFWNDKGRFSSQELPIEGQLSPIYAIYTDDFDNDGNIEIVLGGNQYKAKPQTGIYDGSYGTLLRVDRDRNIKVIDFLESGLHVKGQIRDIKKIKIDKEDFLIITRNNEKIKLYAIKD